MQTLAAFLLAITGSVASRVLLSLGIGIFSYAALSSFAQTVIDTAQANYSSINSTVLQLVNLGGIGQFLGIICSSLIVKASLLSIKRLRPM